MVAAAAVERASAALFALGCAGVEEVSGDPVRQPWETGPASPPAERVELRAWFQAPDRSAVEAALRAAVEGASPPTWRLDRTDWSAEAWRDAFRPLELTATVTVAPPWSAPPGALVIEPGEGFGTGEHATTRLAVRALEALAGPGALLAPPASVLDVGCGSGILALLAARWGHRARGVDVDPAAVADAQRNARLNGLEVELSTAPLSSDPRTYELVVANVRTPTLLALRADLVRAARRWLILSGVRLGEEEALAAAFTPAAVVGREVDGDWVALRLRQPAAPLGGRPL